MFAAAHPVGKTQGVWPGPSPGLRSPPAGGYPKSTCMFGFTSVCNMCHSPMQGPVAQWPVVRKQSMGGELILPRCRQARRATAAHTPKHRFPLRIHSKLCRIQSGLWEPGSRRQSEHVCCQLKLLINALAIRGTPAQRQALVTKCSGTLPSFGGQGEGAKRRTPTPSNTGTHTHTPPTLRWTVMETLLSTLRLTLVNVGGIMTETNVNTYV